MKQEMIEMAREAGAVDISTTKGGGVTVWLGADRPEFIESFAKLVAAKEREECVRRAHIALLGTLESTAARVIHAIRARGEA